MPETKRPLKVFLCHAHSDATAVRALYNRLVKDGVDAWLDKEKLLPGADWEYEIRKAVRESDVVVVCHSKQFNQKGFRQKEVRIALEEADLLPKGEIFIIPARLEECDVLEDLQRWQWVDLFEKDGYENLMRALQVRANKVGATLQIHKGWLPNITSPRSKIEKPIEEKRVASKTNSSEDADTKKIAERETAEKVEQEKAKKELERGAKKVVARYRAIERKIFWSNIRNRLNLIFIDVRYYLLPALVALIVIAGVAYLIFYFPKNFLILNPTPTSKTVVLEASNPTFTALLPNEIPELSSTDVLITSTPKSCELCSPTPLSTLLAAVSSQTPTLNPDLLTAISSLQPTPTISPIVGIWSVEYKLGCSGNIQQSTWDIRPQGILFTSGYKGSWRLDADDYIEVFVPTELYNQPYDEVYFSGYLSEYSMSGTMYSPNGCWNAHKVK